ncbi:MAG: hypothetical protein ABI954_03740 [Pyrinomonadaceae bacterium]
MNREQTFCKSRNCPLTEEIRLFANDELETDEARTVVKHLEECEFCSAEVQFLANFPERGETLPVPELPFQLRQLADIMLAEKTHEQLFLRRLFAKKEFSPSRKASLLT